MISCFGQGVQTLVSNTNTSMSTEEGVGAELANPPRISMVGCRSVGRVSGPQPC